MRTKPQAGPKAGNDDAPATIAGQRTVIHVDPSDITQRQPRQIKVRDLGFFDVIAYVVMASAATLGAFAALAFLLDRVKDWLGV